MIQLRLGGVSARRCRLLLNLLTRICHRIFQVVTARAAAARRPGWWRGYLQSKWNFRFLQYRWRAAWLFNDGLTTTNRSEIYLQFHNGREWEHNGGGGNFFPFHEQKLLRPSCELLKLANFRNFFFNANKNSSGISINSKHEIRGGKYVVIDNAVKIGIVKVGKYRSKNLED